MDKQQPLILGREALNQLCLAGKFPPFTRRVIVDIACNGLVTCYIESLGTAPFLADLIGVLQRGDPVIVQVAPLEPGSPPPATLPTLPAASV